MAKTKADQASMANEPAALKSSERPRQQRGDVRGQVARILRVLGEEGAEVPARSRPVPLFQIELDERESVVGRTEEPVEERTEESFEESAVEAPSVRAPAR